MEELFKIYLKLREQDKKLLKFIPINNRIILSKINTNSNADSELKYAWINRSLAQVSKDKTSAILGLLDSDSEEQKIARRMTLKYRKGKNFPVPFEINNEDDLDKFLNIIDNNYITIKQNYPNYSNDEFLTLKKYNFKNKKIIIANSENSNKIIGSNESLQKVYEKDTIWIKLNIELFFNFFLKKNNIQMTNESFESIVFTMVKLVKSILIPSEFYKGNIDNLRKKIKESLSNNILPVLKFNDSISGYGVHYPKKINGEYNIEEIESVLEDDICFKNYLTSVFDQKENDNKFNNIVEKIEDNGIIIQKYIDGNDYAIGFFKPNQLYSQFFSLGLLDLDISEVLTNGTSHYGDILHYENDFLKSILKNTIFEKQEELFYFSIEILIYLICINEGIIKDPNEFINVEMEDFGIQFMINNKTGDLGLIEINARTPSHNFNHFNLLSIYGEEFWNSNLLASKKILCKSVKIVDIDEFNKMTTNEETENKLIEFFSNKIKSFSDRFNLVSFQIIKNGFYIYYYYFFEVCNLMEETIRKFETYMKDSILEIKNLK